MAFGLSNEQIAFMDMMNGVVKQFLDSFVVVLINDILVYSIDEESH